MPTDSIIATVAAGARISEILVDDATWDAATEARRQEWRVALDDLVAEHRFDTGESVNVRMLVTADPDRIALDAHTLDGQAFHREVVQVAALASHFREYLDICRDMGKLAEGQNSPKLEALDIAKRLVHDEAADTVRSLLRSFRPDLPTSRRLFTLFVTLAFDTTRLVRPHHLDAALYRK